MLAACLLLGVGCKPLKNIGSKDTSTAQKKATNGSDRKDIKFMDNIEVTPGTVVTSKHTTINTRSPKTAKNTTTNTAKPALTSTESTSNVAKVDIEKADYLQMKYAVMLDATVEKLENTTLLQAIDHWWGTPYHLGGTTESGIDCSAFTQALMKTVYEISLLRTAHEQYANCDRISVADLQEGDLVFFHTGSKKRARISHVGLYIMNNKFVHASTSNGVMISDLNDSYWKQHFHGAGRVRK